MMDAERTTGPSGLDIFRRELAECWRQMPDKFLFLGCILLWVLLFHYVGNATLGYQSNTSFFSWLSQKYGNTDDNGHCPLMPFVILGLLWWKRKELLAVPKSPWWPGLGLLVLALLLHVFGFLVQQTLISAAAFFFGFYVFSGIAWGFRMLQVSFFPLLLLIFCVPLSGDWTEKLTFPLRMLVTHITAVLSKTVLGIKVIQDGTRIFDASGSYQYEVAAACSGMRSLVAVVALAVIYAFVMLKSPWRRAVMIAMALPLAVISNVFRLSTIIIASEAFGGQTAGNYVHNSGWMSLLPYIPAIAGVMLIGFWLQEKKKVTPGATPCAMEEQKS